MGFESAWIDLELESPVLTQGIYSSVEDRYSSVVFAETMAYLVSKRMTYTRDGQLYDDETTMTNAPSSHGPGIFLLTSNWKIFYPQSAMGSPREQRMCPILYFSFTGILPDGY